MKTIILSDLYWEGHLRSITEDEIEKFRNEDIDKTRYFSIKRYLNIILEEKANLVLFAGDVTGDGSCGHGFQYAFLILLKILESLKIDTCYISGNHDEPPYYSIVNNRVRDYKYIKEISNKTIDINGVKVLGIPYETTYSKTKIKALYKIIEEDKHQYDIIIAHSQLKRRIQLFDIDTKVIITGHYDRKIMAFNQSAFISLDNDSSEISYAIFNQEESNETVSIAVLNAFDDTYSITEKINNLHSDNREVHIDK
ncbi:MAG: metallophosphoesterase, partial [Saprospiraceae bacterium]